ncbi:MAG TPA: bifunctional alpha/beta hydrolase/class I SAM-dependent methyltransferase [Bryobacteraceae bacterium]|jgi:alpha-beta hydrolase superfamily lysophospholipase|nr:bifunctional alpha/beta hydrolase/class I SAM-dependent methyltransferase [Bryobacteraceae bacterium]
MQQVVAVAAQARTSRSPEERFFQTHDGVKIFFRHWAGTGGRAILLLHRGHEHSGRMAHVVEELDLPEVSFFAWDARAHGRSEGEQRATTTMATFVQDLDEFVRHIRSEFGIAEENIAVVAQSVGAVMAAAWVHDYAPPIRCLVLVAPAFHVKLYVPFARFGLGIWHKLVGDYFVKSYVKGSALTHDPERIESYKTDPLIRLQISARVLLDLYKISDRLVADAAAIRVPTQVLLSGSDWVIRNDPPRRFFERLNTDEKEIYSFDGFFHDTLGEKDRLLPIAKVRAFLEKQFARHDARLSLLNADRAGFTKTEYDRLLRPLSVFSPKGIAFALTKLFLRTIGRLSDGIRLGCDSGFDSGSSLDYVYRNRPAGITPIGKLIDWIYLNSPGWIGIRARKLLLQELIGSAMRRTCDGGRPVRLLDVAAGHGRYVLEAIANSGVRPDNVLLRDFDSHNVELGRRLIEVRKIDARFEQGDAFDRASLLALDPKPTIAIISGLFELFPENDRVRETLDGLAGAIESGGYLIYTGQPWHPQIEFIARTLSSHRAGARWVMRRRTQEELDELVHTAGFRKLEQRIDPDGLFTVTLAERIGCRAET